MIHLFRTQAQSIIAVQAASSLTPAEIEKLQWLFSDATPLAEPELTGLFVGPRR